MYFCTNLVGTLSASMLPASDHPACYHTPYQPDAEVIGEVKLDGPDVVRKPPSGV